MRTPIRTVPAADGRDWAVGKQLRLESFVDPNALCPVCGAPVFFYSSPFGGRVFFDSLGPPWPKHPCTDTYLRRPSLFPSVARRVPKITGASPVPSSGGWRPLIPVKSALVHGRQRILMDSSANLPSRYLYLRPGFIDDRPCYWRRSKNDPGSVEISSFSLDRSGSVTADTLTLYAWIRNDNHLLSIKEIDSPDGNALNSIGWSLSFAWRSEAANWHESQDVDLSLAKTYFKAAADQGNWVALNNLGVLTQSGLVGPPNQEEAFECFTVAAQSLNAVPIRHLAACYRNGFGVTIDLDQASFLDELAAAIENERVQEA